MGDLARGPVILDGGPLTPEAVGAGARRGAPVTLGPPAAERLTATRQFVDRLYGITTGVGKLKDTLIPPEGRVALQRNLVLSHGGVGPPLAEPEVRAVRIDRLVNPRRAVALVGQVLATELLLAAQALDLRAPLEPGRGSRAARDAVRRRIPPLAEDRYLKADLDAALALVEEGTSLAAVEAAIGPLE